MTPAQWDRARPCAFLQTEEFSVLEREIFPSGGISYTYQQQMSPTVRSIKKSQFRTPMSDESKSNYIKAQTGVDY